MRAEFIWDLLTWAFLYQAYCGWMGKNMPQSKPVGKIRFIEALTELVESQPEGWWDASESKKAHRTGDHMDRPEPIIAQYELSDWCDPTVADRRKEPVKYSTFPASRQATAYRGLIRRDPAEMAAARSEEVAGMCEQAGITVTPQESAPAPENAPGAPEAADATASPTSDPFTGPPAPGWPDGSPASHPDHVDPRPGGADADDAPGGTQ